MSSQSPVRSVPRRAPIAPASWRRRSPRSRRIRTRAWTTWRRRPASFAARCTRTSPTGKPDRGSGGRGVRGDLFEPGVRAACTGAGRPGGRGAGAADLADRDRFRLLLSFARRELGEERIHDLLEPLRTISVGNVERGQREGMFSSYLSAELLVAMYEGMTLTLLEHANRVRSPTGVRRSPPLGWCFVGLAAGRRRRRRLGGGGLARGRRRTR